MRYVHSTVDGGVAVTTLRPRKIIRNSDGAVFTERGSRSRGKRRMLYGSWDGGQGAEFDIGDRSFSVGDLTADHIPDHTIVFPDIETDVKRKWSPELRTKVVSTRMGHNDEIPADRLTFRGAWVENNGRVHVDMLRARAIHMERIRRAREAKLDLLDKQWDRAIGQKKPTEADAIEAQRQKLRDIPQTFDLSQADTPEALKTLWPEELK